MKNMPESIRCARKVGEKILTSQNGKKEIKIWKDFWAVKN
jgi:hypothetical protein